MVRFLYQFQVLHGPVWKLLPFCVYFENLCIEEHNCSGEESLATDTVGCLVQCKVAISIVEQWGRVEEMRRREEGEKEGGKEDGSKKGSQRT